MKRNVWKLGSCLRFSLCSRDEGRSSSLQVEEGNVHLRTPDFVASKLILETLTQLGLHFVHADPNSASDFVGSLAHLGS